jgi:hypothetical protein
MTREEKIKVLQAIQEGKLLPEDIKEPEVYVFSQKEDGEFEGWTSKFGEFTDNQLEDFSKERDAINHRRLAVGLSPDMIVKIIRVKKKPNYENEQEAEN